jgi:hypothetical protein
LMVRTDLSFCIVVTDDASSFFLASRLISISAQLIHYHCRK